MPTVFKVDGCDYWLTHNDICEPYSVHQLNNKVQWLKLGSNNEEMQLKTEWEDVNVVIQ